MSIIDTLVTDRTQDDVDARNEKGTYNATDLNRVSAAMEDLKAIMNGYGYDVPGYERLVVKHTNLPGDVAEYDKYTWYHFDTPTVSDTERYLANVQALKNAIPTPSNSSTVPLDMDGFTLNEANAIETILVTIHTLLNNMAAAWFYCGDLYSGEV